MVTDILSSLLSISVLVFSVTSMLSVGLSYTAQQLTAPLRDARGAIRALVANFVLVPLLAYAIVRLLPLDPPMEIGLIVAASAAGAPLLIKLAQIAGGDVALGTTLLVLLLPITIVYMPIIVPLAVPGAVVSAGAIAKPLVLTMLLPLAIGLLVKALISRLAERLQPIMSKVANVALAVLLVTTVLVNFQAVLDMFGTGAILVAFLMIGSAFGVGYLLGGPGRDTRVVLGFGTAQRNYAAAMVVATRSFDDSGVLVMVAVMSTVSMLLLPTARTLGRRAAKLKLSDGAQTQTHGETA